MLDILWNDLCLIDIQCFTGPDGKYIVKEMAICRGNGLQSFLFKTPDFFNSIKFMRTNTYLKDHYHGLSFEMGYIDYSKFTDILNENTKAAKFVFTKGLEKLRFLKLYLPSSMQIIDLNDLGCLKHFNATNACLFHMNKRSMECAMRNCISNQKWLLAFMKFELKRFEYISNNSPIAYKDADYEPFSEGELSTFVSCPFQRLYYLEPNPSACLINFWSELFR